MVDDPSPSFDILADALHDYHPPMRPYDPDDITTWDAAQLDELGLWQAAVDGVEVSSDMDGVDAGDRHSHSLPGDHEHTSTGITCRSRPLDADGRVLGEWTRVGGDEPVELAASEVLNVYVDLGDPI